MQLYVLPFKDKLFGYTKFGVDHALYKIPADNGINALFVRLYRTHVALLINFFSNVSPDLCREMTIIKQKPFGGYLYISFKFLKNEFFLYKPLVVLFLL